MKIQILSDLHLERGLPSWLQRWKPQEGTEVLILAGDITNAKNPDVVGEMFGELKIPVLYILGNHEYYGGDWYDTKAMFKSKYSPLTGNINLLDDDFAMVNGVRFIGSTYWSDIKPSEEGEALSFIADFRGLIAGCTMNLQRQRHRHAQDYLKLCMKDSREKGIDKNVIITHFPPSWQAREERFKASGLGSYFYNDDEALVELLEPNLWIYGHTHGNLNFKVGEIPVVCNQQGYLGRYGHEPCYPDFKPNKTWEV